MNPNNSTVPSFPRRRESSEINTPRSGQDESPEARLEERRKLNIDRATRGLFNHLDSRLRGNDGFSG